MPSNPTPDEMRLALAQQNRVAVPNRPGRTMPADQAKLSYAFTHGLAPMLFGAAKGTVASIPGVVGDVNELLRDYAVPYLPKGAQDVLAKAPAPFTTEQYVNMMPKMGGHTENVATKLGSNVVGAMVDPFAVAGAIKRAPAAGRALAETATNKILAGESLIPGMPAQFINPPVLSAVKPKGGNWGTDNLDHAVGMLKRDIPAVDPTKPLTQTGGNYIRAEFPHIDEDYANYFRGTGQHGMHYAKDYWEWMAKNHPDEFKALESGKTPQGFINQWIDTKLKNYVRNDMATPTDPVRLMADKEVSHIQDIGENWTLFKDARDNRLRGGMPKEGYAQTSKGKDWEARTDLAVAPMSMKEFNQSFPARAKTQGFDVLEQKNPEATVNQVYNSSMRDLGFDHLTDELENAIRPNSDLPMNLRLKPESLEKMTVPQAIERVSKINDWRAAQMEKATAESIKDFPKVKEYDDNYKWLELTTPKNVPEGYKVEPYKDENGKDWFRAIDKDGNNYASATSMDKLSSLFTENVTKLDKALKNEGEMMGHCVGGYTDDVVNGTSRIFTLRDPKNKPHVTIEAVPGVERPLELPPEVAEQFAKEAAQEANELGYAPNSQTWQNYYTGGQLQKADKWARDNSYETVDITQIKGKSNGAVTDKYREMVRDFLNTQPNIGKVHDLDYVDLIDMNNKKSAVSFLNDNYGGDFGVVNSSELYNKVKAANPNMDRFVHASDFSDLVNDVRGPTPEGYKDGGGVSVSDSDPSLQFYSRTMDNPDSSKTTEQGIVKQFEQDYMKFALQRHQAPARSDIPNAQPPAARTNIYGEYGTPALGGMVSGRVTKLGHAPDTYMGDLSYRTPIGPGMAHLGVQGMQSPQMPARMTGYQAGYGVPLGGNGFAGVNVMQPAQGGKPVLGANLQYRRQFAKGGAVRSLESNLPKLPKTDYKSIDELMTEISKRHKTAPKKLHDDFVEKHRMTPDNWIKRK